MDGENDRAAFLGQRAQVLEQEKSGEGIYV
jgi:hypothetical protein